MRMIQ